MKAITGKMHYNFFMNFNPLVTVHFTSDDTNVYFLGRWHFSVPSDIGICSRFVGHRYQPKANSPANWRCAIWEIGAKFWEHHDKWQFAKMVIRGSYWGTSAVIVRACLKNFLRMVARILYKLEMEWDRKAYNKLDFPSVLFTPLYDRKNWLSKGIWRHDVSSLVKFSEEYIFFFFSKFLLWNIDRLVAPIRVAGNIAR